MKVELTRKEMAQAGIVGVSTYTSSVFDGRTDTWDPTPCERCGQPRKGWRVNIEGVCGEMAFCKAMDLFWSPKWNTFKTEGDQAGVEIRTRLRSFYQLMVRPGDPDERPYVLVRGEAPKFEVVGWQYGIEAKRDEWFKDHGEQGKPAYFVPDANLSHDWGGLREWIGEHCNG